jgi:2-dehydro-3-deoxygluconokinase
MLQCTDIAFLTLDDEDALWGEKPVEDVIARTQAAGVSEVVIKRGRIRAWSRWRVKRWLKFRR